MSPGKSTAAEAVLLRFIKSNQFVRQYERFSKSQRFKASLAHLWEALELLRTRTPLPSHFRNHPLGGRWIGWNDLHVAPNLILIWKFEIYRGETLVVLAALGTHAELGLE